MKHILKQNLSPEKIHILRLRCLDFYLEAALQIAKISITLYLLNVQAEQHSDETLLSLPHFLQIQKGNFRKLIC